MKKLLLTFLSLGLLFNFSCHDKSVLESVAHNEHFVTLSQAESIATSIEHVGPSQKKNSSSSKMVKKTVKKIDEIKNKYNKTSLYVVNYEEGGFVMLAADNRVKPIIAFSSSQNFNVDESTFPDPLKFWMDDTKTRIGDIQRSNGEQHSEIKFGWDHVNKFIFDQVVSNSGAREDPFECYDHTETVIKEHLMSTYWEQEAGYNASLTEIYCYFENTIRLPYAGCVPIAIAQVMKYHEYPTSFNWSNMPDNSATTTTANFIKDIHDKINNVGSGILSYNCDGTGASTGRLWKVFKEQYGYSSASSTQTYNSTTVRSNIASNLPVLLEGVSTITGTGHMWVADGFKEVNLYNSDCGGQGYYYFRMNWGWGVSFNDVWYSYGNFNPGDRNYNNNKKMMVNIYP